MPSASIVYGWSEGPWQSRQLRRLLEQAGFKIIKHAAQADVIVAHSLGCYLVPRVNQAKVVMLIGLPYWPGRSLVSSVLRNTAENLKDSHGSGGSSWWLNKLLHNLLYIFIRPTASYRAMSSRKVVNLPADSSKRRVLLIRNSADTFSHPDIQKLVPQALGYEHIKLASRQHENCWLHPEPYVKLIEKYYE